MAKFQDRQIARLERRVRGYVEDKNGATARPGSMNPHKFAALGTGRRSRNQIHAASRSATTR